jgi:hypothetical protein
MVPAGPSSAEIMSAPGRCVCWPSGIGLPDVIRAARSYRERILPEPGSPFQAVTLPLGIRRFQSHSTVSGLMSALETPSERCATGGLRPSATPRPQALQKALFPYAEEVF